MGNSNRPSGENASRLRNLALEIVPACRSPQPSWPGLARPSTMDFSICVAKTWIPGTSPGMTVLELSSREQAFFFEALVHIGDELAVAVPHKGRTPLIGAEDALRRLAPARM